MTYKNLILSPCGTSILTNQCKMEERQLLNRYANQKDKKNIPKDDLIKIEEIVSRVTDSVKNISLEDAQKFSAELNCIIKFYNKNLNRPYDYHLLICTDTFLGEITANIVKQWLDKHNIYTEIKKQRDLQTYDLQSFRLALIDLVRFCHDFLQYKKYEGYKVIFNLTGGFKSVQGFLQTLASFYADECLYIFETSQELMRIPRMPIKISAEEEIKNNIRIYRRLSLSLKTDVPENIPETMYMEIDGEYMISEWGEIIFKQLKQSIYSEMLLDPPSDKIVYSQKFVKQCNELPKDRLVLVNERIDQLSQYFELPNKPNPRSLDFKIFASTKNSTTRMYQIDAWTDKDAKRIYGYFDNDIFVIDEITKGAH